MPEWKESDRSCMSIHLLVYQKKEHTHCTRNAGLVPKFHDLFEVQYRMLQGRNQVLILPIKLHCRWEYRLLISGDYHQQQLSVSINYFQISGLVYIAQHYPCPPPPPPKPHFKHQRADICPGILRAGPLDYLGT